DVDEAGAVVLAVNQMAVPDLVEQGAWLGHGRSRSLQNRYGRRYGTGGRVAQQQRAGGPGPGSARRRRLGAQPSAAASARAAPAVTCFSAMRADLPRRPRR